MFFNYLVCVTILTGFFVAILKARDYLSKLGDLGQTQIFAKIENVEVSCIHY